MKKGFVCFFPALPYRHYLTHLQIISVVVLLWAFRRKLTLSVCAFHPEGWGSHPEGDQAHAHAGGGEQQCEAAEWDAGSLQQRGLIRGWQGAHEGGSELLLLPSNPGVSPFLQTWVLQRITNSAVKWRAVVRNRSSCCKQQARKYPCF